MRMEAKPCKCAIVIVIQLLQTSIRCEWEFSNETYASLCSYCVGWGKCFCWMLRFSNWCASLDSKRYNLILDRTSVNNPILDRTSPYNPILDRTSPCNPILDMSSVNYHILDRTSVYNLVLDVTSPYNPILDMFGVNNPVLDMPDVYDPILNITSIPLYSWFEHLSSGWHFWSLFFVLLYIT